LLSLDGGDATGGNGNGLPNAIIKFNLMTNASDQPCFYDPFANDVKGVQGNRGRILGVIKTADEVGAFHAAIAKANQDFIVNAWRPKEAGIVSATGPAKPCQYFFAERGNTHLHLGLGYKVTVVDHDTFQHASQ
jgi:hypothetical protein